MVEVYHTGERAVQARAGVRAAADRVGGVIGESIPAQARAFVAAQQIALVAAMDAGGQVWASMLTGAPGLVAVLDARTLHIDAEPQALDPLAGALTGARARTAEVGVLLIDFATRRRLRVNGTAHASERGGVTVRVQRAYWICPKYIQRRQVVAPAAVAKAAPRAAVTPPSPPSREPALSARQRDWITRADTFFIASTHATAGADASHRGGSPGFVQLTTEPRGAEVLTFPDYAGNNMFNTFGNLAMDPRAGLLFVDFETGATLHLTGTAEVLWAREQFGAFPGAERAVRFRIAEALETRDATALRWRLAERSPFNPPAPRTFTPPDGARLV